MTRNILLTSILLSLIGCDADSEGDNNNGLADSGSSDGDILPTTDARIGNDVDATPIPSDGCESSATVSRVDFMHGGRSRGATLVLPSNYNGSPMPLMLNFHGRNSTTSQQQLLSGMDADANSAGYIVAYPEGVGNTFNAGFCCGEAQSLGIDDVGYSKKLVQEIAAKLCIDTAKVYATGLSNGGYMVQRLACDAADVFAGFASVAGLAGTLNCQPSQKRPIIHFHGTADNIVSYNGVVLGGAQELMDDWAARNGCTPGSSVVYNQGDASCIRYDGCPDKKEVEFCTIDGGGHTWPGGTSLPGLGHTSTDISANDYMWQFFQRN